MKIWRINTRTQEISVDPIPTNWEKLGGRGLIARVLVDGVKPTCDPLGRENKLIFTPGLMVGHKLSSCDRISVGGKSPLTKGVKEANAGGRTGLHLASLGIRALILEDVPEESGLWILYLSKSGIQFVDASHLVGMGVYDTAAQLVQEYGNKVAISLIGLGGEMKLKGAGIQNIDNDLVPSRIAARGGLGAVMGSKGIKAIVIDAEDCASPPLKDEKVFKVAQKNFNKALLEHPQVRVYTEYGTAAMANMCHSFGALPTRNFSNGRFDGVDSISGEFLRDQLLERGGESKPSHACMAGCVIRCSNVYADKNGKEIVSPLEYETIGLMGSNLGIKDLDIVAKLNWEVNDLGLDSIEIGAALGVAAEAGIFEFGDGEGALETLANIRKGTELGEHLGNGALATGEALGVERVPVVKGQAMSAYDPRAIKGTGITYATSPQGADHTCGLTIRAKVDHLDPKNQVELSRNGQINMAGYDTLGVCLFAGFGFGAVPEAIKDLINARYGWGVGLAFLQELGEETLILERQFNTAAGFTKEDDRIPTWMMEEPLPPHSTIFDVSEEDLDNVFDDGYLKNNFRRLNIKN